MGHDETLNAALVAAVRTAYLERVAQIDKVEADYRQAVQRIMLDMQTDPRTRLPHDILVKR